MKIFVVSLLLLIVGAFAANENDGSKNNSGIKTKRAYTLGYGYSAPIAYDHDFIAHEPIVHQAAAITHPIIPAIHTPITKTSVVSTSVHHLPIASSYIAPAHVPIVAPAEAYVAHHPLYTEFHRR